MKVHSFRPLLLSLADASGAVLSDNFYWQGKEEGNYQALRTLGKTRVKKHVKALSSDCFLVTVKNTGKVPALMIRLKAVDSATGDMILPVWYSDNYFFLMPGESKDVEIRISGLHGRFVMETEGMNL